MYNPVLESSTSHIFSTPAIPRGLSTPSSPFYPPSHPSKLLPTLLQARSHHPRTLFLSLSLSLYLSHTFSTSAYLVHIYFTDTHISARVRRATLFFALPTFSSARFPGPITEWKSPSFPFSLVHFFSLSHLLSFTFSLSSPISHKLRLWYTFPSDVRPHISTSFRYNEMKSSNFVDIFPLRLVSLNSTFC